MMRMHWRLSLVLAPLACADLAHAVGSCGMGGPLGETLSVEHEGSVYYVTTPDGYDDTLAWPLIFGLHGDEGDPADSVNWFWQDVVNESFIFVAPKAPNASGSWYEETQSNSAWMDGLLERVSNEYNVDLDRIYIWGLSGGAVFSSDYALARQDVFAAVEFNMGGSARGYSPAPSEACRIPARFVVSETDFLRENALGLFEELTQAGHETLWIDADCQGHCFDQEQAGPVARDWLLSFTLCGAIPSAGCRDEAPSTSDTTTATATSSMSTGSATTGGATTTGAGTDSATGTTSTGGGTNSSTTGSTAMVTGAGGSSVASTTLGEPTSSATTGTVDSTNAAPVDEAGCACRVTGPPSEFTSEWRGLLLLALLGCAFRRRSSASA